MIYAALFIGGTFFGLVLAVIAVVTAIRTTPDEREREPIHISAIGAGRARTTGPETLFDAIDRRLM